MSAPSACCSTSSEASSAETSPRAMPRRTRSAEVNERSPRSTRSTIGCGSSSSRSALRVHAIGAPTRRDTSAAVSDSSSAMIRRAARANWTGSGLLWWKFSANCIVSASRREIPSITVKRQSCGSPSASSTSAIAARRRWPASSSYGWSSSSVARTSGGCSSPVSRIETASSWMSVSGPVRMLVIGRTADSGAVIVRCGLPAVSATGARRRSAARTSRCVRAVSSCICATSSSASWSLSTDMDGGMQADGSEVAGGAWQADARATARVRR